jgi:hypothetical protein
MTSELLIWTKGSNIPRVIELDNVEALVMNDGKSIYDLWINKELKKQKVKENG